MWRKREENEQVFCIVSAEWMPKKHHLVRALLHKAFYLLQRTMRLYGELH